MKKLVFLLSMTAMMIVACTNNSKEIAKADSLKKDSLKKDSIAKVEAVVKAKKDSLAKDSLKKDSIAKCCKATKKCCKVKKVAKK